MFEFDDDSIPITPRSIEEKKRVKERLEEEEQTEGEEDEEMSVVIPYFLTPEQDVQSCFEGESFEFFITQERKEMGRKIVNYLIEITRWQWILIGSQGL